MLQKSGGQAWRELVVEQIMRQPEVWQAGRQIGRLAAQGTSSTATGVVIDSERQLERCYWLLSSEVAASLRLVCSTAFSGAE